MANLKALAPEEHWREQEQYSAFLIIQALSETFGEL
jgi:hypothetical protein